MGDTPYDDLHADDTSVSENPLVGRLERELASLRAEKERAERERDEAVSKMQQGWLEVTESGINHYKEVAERAEAELVQWSTWGVIEVMTRNPNVDSFVREKEAELAACRADAERLRWLLEDHDHPATRESRNSLLNRMQVMSYSAACTDIDAAIAARKGEQ